MTVERANSGSAGVAARTVPGTAAVANDLLKRPGAVGALSPEAVRTRFMAIVASTAMARLPAPDAEHHTVRAVRAALDNADKASHAVHTAFYLHSALDGVRHIPGVEAQAVMAWEIACAVRVHGAAASTEGRSAFILLERTVVTAFATTYDRHLPE